MKRILIILLLAVVAFPAFAQMGSPIIIPIWPDGAPNDNGIVTEEGQYEHPKIIGLRTARTLIPVRENPAVKAGLFRVCGRGDSNPHAFRHQILSLGCLPIPTLPHEGDAKVRKNIEISRLRLRLRSK